MFWLVSVKYIPGFKYLYSVVFVKSRLVDTMDKTLEKVKAAGNEISAVLEKHEMSELEAIMVLESVRISIQASIMRKSGAFVPGVLKAP